MANAFSVFRARQGWIDPTDQDFTLKALMFKQQKYDANQAKVQSIVDKYQSLQLARGVDREYLNSRLTQLLDSANALGPQDLSSNAVTASITNHIGQVLDNNVMTAVQETAKIRAYQDEVNQIKEKKPELYNQLNEAYGLAPAQAYMQSTELGAKIQGTLTYNPYQDVEGEINKTLLDIQKSSKDGVIEIPVMQAEIGSDGKPTGRQIRTGETQKVTINGRSPNELRQIAMGLIGNKYDTQLGINAWGNTGGFKDLEKIVNSSVVSYNNLISSKTKELAKVKSTLTGNPTDSEKEVLENQVKTLENDILDAQQMISSIQSNPKGALVYLEKEKIANRSAISIGALQTRSVEYNKDDYFFSHLEKLRQDAKDAFEIQKYNNDVAMKSRELELKEMEIGIKAAKGSKDSDSDSESSGAGGGVNDIVFETVNPTETLPEQLESAHNSWKEDISNKYQVQDGIAKRTLLMVNDMATGRNNNIKPEQKEAAKAAINEFKQNGGNVNSLSSKEAQKFMKILTRANSFEDLTFLPDSSGRLVNIKQNYTRAFNDWSQSSSGYRNAKLKAQQAEAVGKKRGFAENEYFIEQAQKLAPGIYTERVANPIVTKKNKGALQTLISMTDEARGSGEVPILEEDTPLKIKDLKNGKYEVTYFSKSKDTDKNNVIVPNTVTITQDNLFSVLPGLSKGINTPYKYTLASMGTKPLYSKSLKFLDTNSSNYEAYVDSIQNLSGNPTDVKFLNSETAKDTLKQNLGIVGIRDSRVREQLNNLVDTLLSDSIMQNYKTSVYFNNSVSSNNGKGYVSIVNKRGDNLATLNYGNVNYLDKDVEVNEWAPQINYTKVIGNELFNVINKYKQTGKLEIPTSLQKILTNG